MKKLPKTLTKKLYICARRDICRPDSDYSLNLNDFNLAGGSNPSGYILLGTTEVTVDIPECNPVQAEIEAIKKARDQILADAQLQATQLDERIQRLLCIEHEVRP